MQFFTDPGPMLGIVIVVSSVLVSVTGVCIVRRQVHYSKLREDHEAAGFVYSMIGMVYAVLLGFITVVVWQQYRDAQNHVQHEAVRISNLLRDAQVFPESVRDELEAKIVTYVKAVISDEWHAMSQHRISPVASNAYEDIWNTVYRIQTQTKREQTFYRESITRLNDLGAIRRSRLLSGQSRIPSLLWILLISGAVICVAFTYMFSAKNTWLHMATTGALAGIIAFILFLILTLSCPFSGSLRIGPEPLTGVLQMWRHHHHIVIPH